jgi:hypothetical protein
MEIEILLLLNLNLSGFIILVNHNDKFLAHDNSLSIHCIAFIIILTKDIHLFSELSN